MTNGETADQTVRMTLEGIQVASNITLKVGGEVAKSLASTLYAILTDKKKVKGKTRLNSLLKSGKELKVFAIRHDDLKLFCEEAKRYGVLYSVLKEKNNTDGICDIMVRAEDASKISRIVDKFELATVDTKAIRESIMNDKKDILKDVPTLTEKEHDDLVSELLGSTRKQTKGDKPFNENPTIARTQKKNLQFEQKLTNSSTIEGIRPSVRKELSEIKIEREKRIFKNKRKSRHQNSKGKKHTKGKLKVR